MVRALLRAPDLQPVVVNTGQHKEMLDGLLDELDVEADHHLGVMRPAQPLSSLTGRLIHELGTTVRQVRPEAVVVQGDTAGALAGAIAGFYEHVPVAHVEAGLRSGILGDPFPEEVNRRFIGQLARWHFAPTERAASNLRAEGVDDRRIEMTGNTVIDNLLWALGRPRHRGVFGPGRRRVLVTLHRRENQGRVMEGLARALALLAEPGDVEVVLPLHKSPTVREVLVPALAGLPGVRLVEPFGYTEFVAAMADAEVILTDSGGVQEEAPTLGRPVVVLRQTTERHEAIEAGFAHLAGIDPARICSVTRALLESPVPHAAAGGRPNPFGDGKAAERIVGRLRIDLAGTADGGRADGGRLAGLAAPAGRAAGG
ncbi:MAG: non-hydrolyzing UDP-N-acetylglucosamine 2-epimerase [Acidimicrobiales bacterium]